MKKYLLSFVISVVMTGCVHHIRMERIEQPPVMYSSATYFKSFVIGAKKIAYIGQPIVVWQEATIGVKKGKVPSIEFQDDFNLVGKYKVGVFTEHVDIKGVRGDKRKLVGEVEIDGKKYHVIQAVNAVNDGQDNNKKIGLLIDSNGVLNTNMVANEDCDYVFKANESALIPPTAHFLYVLENPEEKAVIRPDGMSRELIFGGVNNVSINVTYREYTSDSMARQAFYQNITYRTSADIIRFQNFKIKVHEVTNEKIVFTVVEDGL
jgi:hypothetical protein